MSKHRKGNPHKHGRSKTEWVVGILFCVVVIALFLAAGQRLSALLYQVTGQPSEAWAVIIAGLLGMTLLTIVAKLLIHLYHKRYKGVYPHSMRSELLDRSIDAMNRIAQGDFTVLLPPVDHDPYANLTETVNRMARELGSMEQLRQDFISNVSHEIQSPLTSISGFAALLKNDSVTPEQRVHYLGIIETEAKRLSKLSDNLLKLSTLENNARPLVLAEFRLDKQIQNAALILEPQWAAKQIDLSLTLEKVQYTGDENLLAQVWMNLLHNAVKFTPEQGRITVALKGDAKAIVCRISDTGMGISEEDQMHIFERFYKADKSRDRSLGGNGLGLSLVKKIVALHGGSISLESALHGGSVFIVTLPTEKAQ